MINCSSVYNIMLDLVRKDKRGRSLSVDEFNNVIINANMRLWNDNMKVFEEDANVTAAMAIFKELNKSITLVAGKSTLPTDYSRVIGEPRATQIVGADTYIRKVDVITSEEYTERVTDYLTQPTATYPVCVIGGSPSGSITQILSYLGVSLCYSTAHGLKTGDTIIISGTTSYNGVRVVTKITDDTFSIPVAFVSDQTGTWVGQGLVNINVNPDSITTLYLDYLRNPHIPFLDYYINDTTLEYTFLTEGAVAVSLPTGNTYRDGTIGGVGITVNSLTVDFEWDSDSLNKLIAIMLGVLGIQLENVNVYQAGNLEETKS